MPRQGILLINYWLELGDEPAPTFDPQTMRYLIYGFEAPHWKMYVQFLTKKRFTAVKKIWPTAVKIDARNSPPHGWIEHGDPPQAARVAQVIAAVADGHTLNSAVALQFIRATSGMNKYRARPRHFKPRLPRVPACNQITRRAKIVPRI
jgi:hypothetical protein